MKRFLILIPLSLSMNVCSSENIWQDLGTITRQDNGSDTQPCIDVDRSRFDYLQLYRHLVLDEDALHSLLPESTNASKQSNIQLPLPSGDFASVTATLTETLSPEIAAQNPEIHTWKVKGIDGKVINGVIDFNMLGFHAMLDIPDGDTVFIDPMDKNGERTYANFSKKNNPIAFQRACTENTK